MVWVNLQPVKSLAESQASRHKKEMEKNWRRDEFFFQFQREQTEVDQQHESHMMRLIMTMQQQQKQLLISPPVPLAPQHRYNNAPSTFPLRHFQNLLPAPPTSPPLSLMYQTFRQHQMPVSSPPGSFYYYRPWNTAPKNLENPQPPASWKNIVCDMILQTFTFVLCSYCICWVLILLWLYIMNM